MNCKKTKIEKGFNNILKYFIFNIIVFCGFLGISIFNNVKVEAANESYTYKFLETNYHNGSVVHVCKSGSSETNCDKTISADVYDSGWYAEASGIEGKTVIVFELTVDRPLSDINGITIFETGYTSSSATGSYDSYKKNASNIWSSLNTDKIASGSVVANASDVSADNNTLVANNSASTYYSLFYIAADSTDNTKTILKYAYTIRNKDYGSKEIAVVFYNDNAYNYEVGDLNDHYSVTQSRLKFVASKPANEFEKNWISADDEECGITKTSTNAPETNKVCIKYVNGTKTNETTTMTFALPKEMAYIHDYAVTETTVGGTSKIDNASIVDNSMYGINTFQNVGSASGIYVKYYYYNFLNLTNENVNPTQEYTMKLTIDASGKYVFYITDIFGNKLTTDGDGEVTVNDVSRSNIIIDYTNEDSLTLMSATSGYTDNSWKQKWNFTIDGTTIVFTKMVKGEITVELYVFQRIVINEGVFASELENVEDIAKQPLGYNNGAHNDYNEFYNDGFVIWRVKTITGDDGDNTNVSCGTGAANVCYSDLNFQVGDYSAGTVKNKVTFKITNNGRYRVQVTDNYGNSTNNPIVDNNGGNDDIEKNPAVEVSVIDRTTPVITSELNGSVDDERVTSIESYLYVIGGGEKLSYIPGYYEEDGYTNSLAELYYTIDSNYDLIYYNSKGLKIFNYEDALKIAKISVRDDVEYYDGTNFDADFSKYEINYGYSSDNRVCYDKSETSTSVAEGVYCDPSLNYKSDRNTSATDTWNLHEYIVNNNITSFTRGLAMQAGYAQYAGTTADKYSEIDSSKTGAQSTTDLHYVNESGTFLGYLKIEFTKTDGTNICTLTIGDGSKTNNENCFKAMNKQIDNVENFNMVFTAVDDLGNNSNTYTITVNVIDTTNPGIDGSEIAKIEYTNTSTDCRLEIGNYIQIKTNILECYKLKTNTNYHVIDNNVHGVEGNTDLSLIGYQYYDKKTDGSDNGVSDADYYFRKIKLSVYENGWAEITDDDDSSRGNQILKKSGDHVLKMEISDHWATYTFADSSYKLDNKLVVYVNYYVNPRTLLIEPLANDKMYGEDDPVFDYCAYVNNDKNTFNLEDNFFDVNFVNTYFNKIYCTKDVYVEIENTNRYNSTLNRGTSTYPYSADTYPYNTFAQHNTGEYLKVNETYVKIEDAKRYSMSYTQDNNGDYLKVGSEYYEMLNGYKYKDSLCRYAYMGEGNVYFKAGSTCVQVESTNRYKQTYTQSTSGAYLKYNDGTINSALVNSNEFQGKLSRVESSCYNSFTEANKYNYSTYLTCADELKNRNDNVGTYHIVLGTISIKIGSDGVDYNDDYVIKINTNYWTTTTNFGQTQTRVIKDGNGKLIDDTIFEESTVNFTIRQAVLTIEANGGSKKFGEQDSYSNVWNNVTTAINNSSTGYLSGYTIYGWRNGDENNGGANSGSTMYATNNYVIEGTLRREVGEEVGIYDICNIKGNPSLINASDCTAESVTPGVYATNGYYFDTYGVYTNGGESDKAALLVRTNGTIYGNSTGRTLNINTRNYAISFVKSEYTINAVDIIIQPGINQGKEYAATEYHDPLWQLVVYGETIKYDSDNWITNVAVSADANGFSGYTATVAVENNVEESSLGLSPYYSDDSEVYYMRRKVSPAGTYKYIKYLKIADYTKYTKNGDYYVNDDSGNYIYAYGKYYEVINDDRYTTESGGTQSASGTYLKVEISGRLVNQSYSLFDSDFVLTRESGINVGWYSYEQIFNIKDGKYTIKANSTDNQECIIDSSSVTINASDSARVVCRRYNVVYTNTPSSLTDGEYVTTHDLTNTTIYKPDGINACTDSTIYSLACSDSNKYEITFEIFKREIVLEFIDENYTFTYGQRYNYYDGGSYNEGGTVYTYNGNSNGIFNIKDTTSEGNIFLCYSDLGDYLVDCTNNNDYGLTKGDTWSSIGLKFYLHDTVSSYSSGYYKSDDKALPAGRYYVYAEIAKTNDSNKNDQILNNYLFTYKGGTLTIKPKVTSVQLTGYTKEYGEQYFFSYGVGSNYTEYTVIDGTKCMTDAAYYSGADTLISDCASLTNNQVGNTYGFVIEGLDSVDTIAQNFKGRPQRETRKNDNKQFDDVGYYKINVGNITTIKDTRVNFTSCSESGTDCVFDSSYDTNNAINYDITYSITNNEGAYLFITPATLKITVYPNQTKMYGCAYDTFIDSQGNYYIYDYENGYTNCRDDSGEWKIDLAYKYTIVGDKDNNSYTSGYDVSTDTSGNRIFLTKGGDTAITISAVLNDERLYRIVKSSDGTYDYADIKSKYSGYQGQAVNVYTITLGKLDVNNNSNTSMCDAFNNPILNGGSTCQNYNINYYGNSTSTDSSVNEHSYYDETSVNATDLTLYTLKYTVNNTDGKYVLIDGKFVQITDYKNSLINAYKSISSVTKYKKVADYVKSSCTSGENCYVYLDGTYKKISEISSLRYTDSSGTTASATGNYLKVDKKRANGEVIKTNYIQLDQITKFEKTSETYVEDASGLYIKLNNEYVQLNSVKKYSYDSTTSRYTENTSGEYILMYEARNLSDFTRYDLSVTEMYDSSASLNTANNVYAFVNGSYVPYNSLIQTAGKINVNKANLTTGVTHGDASNDVIFTITARIVHVHTEYNVKPYGEDDPVETISCSAISSANGLTNWEGRSYCSASGEIELGVSMYYAIKNSLAKAPWTAWTDSSRSNYNDIQFDVLTGKIDRKKVIDDGKYDTAGKYTFDFMNVTNVGTINGDNYMIYYETKTSMEETYVKTGASTYSKLSDVLYETCDAGDKYCANGRKIKNNQFALNYTGGVVGGGTLTSISLIDKYNSSYNPISYWYLGFYKNDTTQDREGELAKWWNNDTKSVFESGYDTFKTNVNIDANYKFNLETKEIYFEIIRRTIYLYAVDESKIYGESDNYQNFRVAICSNDQGYIVDGNGVKCKSEEAAYAYGLSTEDASMFLASGYMKQDQIKNNGVAGNYIFQGQTHLKNSFGIYFRRDVGENAGYYKVTACAYQSDITDCTDKSQGEKVNTPVLYLGDTYKIIEVSGVLTIQSREIKVTPNSNQGYAYGNYTENGSVPNIIFSETHGEDAGLVFGGGIFLFNETTEITELTMIDNKYQFTISGVEYVIDGLNVYNKDTKQLVTRIIVNGSDITSLTKTLTVSGTTYTIIQKAKCYIDVSGIHTTCINDAQNEALTNNLNDAYYVLAASYSTTQEVVYDYTNTKSVGDLMKVSGYRTYYNYNVYNDTYSNSANAYTRDESYARHALNLDCGSTSGLRYSREVCEYTITQGDLSISDNVKRTTEFYVQIMNSKRYTKSGEVYTQSDTGDYLKYGDGAYVQITSSNRYKLDTDNQFKTDTEGEYVKVSVTMFNYTLNEFTSGVKYNVTAANITVTPNEKQYKIYGDADPEIKFTVETVYTVADTQYQNFSNSNIVKYCNGSTCYEGEDLNQFRYNGYGSDTKSTSGSYILLIKGWQVYLNSFAYDEEVDALKATNLDYGLAFTNTKHDKSTSTLSQDTTGIIHYDKYTTYNTSISTSRILLGNLYIDGHIQTVGEKNIVNGMSIAKNTLGNNNYILEFTTEVKFVIVPRPVSVAIKNITKTYGQATDKTTCDSTISDCVVGDGILTATDNDGLLINNYDVLTDKSSYSNQTIETTTYTSLTVNYGNSVNMPTQVSASFDSTNIYNGFVSVDVGHYYTETLDSDNKGAEEKKNDTLNIKVERIVDTDTTYNGKNIARGNAVCMISETYCEDVGEYNLKFNVRNTIDTKESTVANAYYNEYWGYNPNYYVIVYNNFEDSGWETSEGYTSISANSDKLSYDSNDSLPIQSATLKIRKRSIQIVVETVSEYDYTQSSTGNYLKVSEDKYYLILDSNRYTSSDGKIQSKDGNYLCYYGETCVEIVNTNRYTRKVGEIGEKYRIEQNMDVPTLPQITNDTSIHHTTYDTANNQQYITWYEHPRQVRTSDELYGNAAYCTTPYNLGSGVDRDTIRAYSSYNCSSGNLRYYYGSINPNDLTNTSTMFDTSVAGYYIITRDTNQLYIRNSATINNGNYEANNYTTDFVNGILQIDLDETPPVINIGTEFLIKESNNGNMSLGTKGDILSFLENNEIRTNNCVTITTSRDGDSKELVKCKNASGNEIVFTYTTNSLNTSTPTISYDAINTLLEWFDITSYDPSLMRAGSPVAKRYDERLYITIQSDFDQRKTGDYTLYIYAQDNAGNISLASLVTLRIVDTTKPTVGTLNLYEAKVKCKDNTDCSKEENWVVAEDIYLPILNFTAERLTYFTDRTKYAYSNGSYTVNTYFGTYYKITIGTDARAVKHTGWTNSTAGIYLTITGGDDNSLSYLNLDNYTNNRYNISGSGYVSNGSGTHLLLGSLIPLSNVTRYREVKLDSNGNEVSGGTNTVYIPDKEGTIIRYKGYYYDLSTGAYIGGTPTNDEYKVKLVQKNATTNVYTSVTSATKDEDTGYAGYFIQDGELYEIPSVKYEYDSTNNQYKHSDSGTYVNFAQWDHYYSRDGGNSWVKYSRDAVEGYLALGQDGQRLIMIKAIDNGYTYTSQTVTKTYTTAAYCYTTGSGTCSVWQKVVIATTGYTNYNNVKEEKYNISDWSGVQGQDIKYAYLDTISPITELGNSLPIEVFEYGCIDITKCNQNHDETFGSATDGYLVNLNKIEDRYTKQADNTYKLDVTNGTYLRFNGGFVEITNERRFAYDSSNTNKCVGNASSGCAFTQSNTGNYLYLGKTDASVTIDSLITEKVNGRIDNPSVYNEVTTNTDTITMPASGTEENLQNNTNYIQSGLGLGATNTFDGVGNTSLKVGSIDNADFEIDYKYTTIFVYLEISNGNGAVSGNDMFDAKGFYKYNITKNASNKFEVRRCFNASTKIKESQWCDNPSTAIEYSKLDDALEGVLAVYKAGLENANAFDFNGNDLVFNIDYRVSDLAGNQSLYVRKGILFTSFTSNLVVNNNGSITTQALLSVDQNTSLVTALSNVTLDITSSGGLRSQERIVQTIYYNGNAIAVDHEYDVETINSLDTSAPGEYRIVYNTIRKDGDQYIRGNEVELVLQIKPNTVNISNNIDYKILIIGLAAIITVGFVAYISIRRKQNSLN